jgi:hypothetical protein
MLGAREKTHRAESASFHFAKYSRGMSYEIRDTSSISRTSHTTERSRFFGQLRRPDFYPKSCSGEADAYEADIYEKNPDGSYTVTITDGSAIEYPDGTHRDYIANGTKVIVSSKKINPLSKPSTIRPATRGCS